MRSKEKNKEYMQNWRKNHPEYEKNLKKRQRVMDNYRRREAFTHVHAMHHDMTLQLFKKLLKKGYTIHEMSQNRFFDPVLYPKKVS